MPTLRRFAALLIATPSVCVAALIAGALPARANPPGPHDPVGTVTRTAYLPGGVQFTGWAVDPDSPASNVTLWGLRDGHIVLTTRTSTAAKTTVKKAGRTPGFAVTVPAAADGRLHTVCIAAASVGAGTSTVLSCAVSPKRTLTAAQAASHSPVGSMAVSHSGTRLTVSGYATDPDFVNRHGTVVLYLDGASIATVSTTRIAAAVKPSNTRGTYSAFTISRTVASGAHLACIWVVNIGLGSNSTFGCTALDTRTPGSGKVTTPAANTKVIAEAKKHIGQAYVWGATGPSTFDCSGLVQYSYRKAAAISTPRVSSAQFAAAHLIPASRAVAGDLVFYHDREGSVYHVGIYLSPGRSVAAIDTAEGVDYQSTTWDPTITYGSFTHS